jgi:hypothetical protein
MVWISGYQYLVHFHRSWISEENFWIACSQARIQQLGDSAGVEKFGQGYLMKKEEVYIIEYADSKTERIDEKAIEDRKIKIQMDT